MATLKRIIYLTKLRLWTTFGTIYLNRFLCSLFLFLSVSSLDTGRKLNVQKTFTLRRVSMGSVSLLIWLSVSLCLSAFSLSLSLSLSLCVSMIWYGTYTFGTYTLVTFTIYYNNSCNLDVITNQNHLINILTKNN